MSEQDSSVVRFFRVAEEPHALDLGIDNAPKDGRFVLVFGDVEGMQGAEGPGWIKAAWRKDYPAGQPYWQWGAPGYTGMVRNATHWYPLPFHPNAITMNTPAALQAHCAALRAALDEWWKLACHLHLSTDSHKLRTEKLLAATPEQSLAALTAPLEAKIYALREAVQFVLDCGSEDVDWYGETTKQSTLEVCRKAMEATPEECAAKLQRVRAEAAAEALERMADEQERRGLLRFQGGIVDDYAKGFGTARLQVATRLRDEAKRLREAAR